MKILHYNILNGCRKEPERLAQLGAWLRTEAADLVAFNELNGWTSETLASAAATWGYDYAHVMELHSQHHLGVIARDPFQIVAEIDEGFHHGLLDVRCSGLRLLITHLTPVSAVDRHREAELLAERVGGIAGPAILIGDLNTLSPLDAPWYETIDARTELSSAPPLRRKFLSPDDAIDYGPMQCLLDAGLIDAGAQQQVRHSVPTPFNKDPMHAVLLRLDYALANSAAAGGIQWVCIRHGEEVDSLSDHYPLEVVWDSPAGS